MSGRPAHLDNIRAMAYYACSRCVCCVLAMFSFAFYISVEDSSI